MQCNKFKMLDKTVSTMTYCKGIHFFMILVVHVGGCLIFYPVRVYNPFATHSTQLIQPSFLICRSWRETTISCVFSPSLIVKPPCPSSPVDIGLYPNHIYVRVLVRLLVLLSHFVCSVIIVTHKKIDELWSGTSITHSRRYDRCGLKGGPPNHTGRVLTSFLLREAEIIQILRQSQERSLNVPKEEMHSWSHLKCCMNKNTRNFSKTRLNGWLNQFFIFLVICNFYFY